MQNRKAILQKGNEGRGKLSSSSDTVLRGTIAPSTSIDTRLYR